MTILFVTAFVDMIGVAMVLPLLPYYATNFGANALVVGLLISAFSVAQLACAPFWGRFSDRYGRRPAIITGLLLSAVAYVIFAFAGSVALLLISRVVQGLGGGTIGVVQAYVADASPPEERTKSLGWLSAVTSLSAVVGPAFGSVAVGIGGQMAPGIAAAALAALVAAFAWRFLREARECGIALQRTSVPAHLDLRRCHWGVLRDGARHAAAPDGPVRDYRTHGGLRDHVLRRHGRGGAGHAPAHGVDDGVPAPAAAGFRARTNAAMKRPFTCWATASASRPASARNARASPIE